MCQDSGIQRYPTNPKESKIQEVCHEGPAYFPFRVPTDNFLLKHSSHMKSRAAKGKLTQTKGMKKRRNSENSTIHSKIYTDSFNLDSIHFYDSSEDSGNSKIHAEYMV